MPRLVGAKLSFSASAFSFDRRRAPRVAHARLARGRCAHTSPMERDDGTGASTSPAPDEPGESFEFVPAPTVAALDACRYARWHAIPALAKHAYGSLTVRLPPEYVRYLLEDGLHLAADSEAMPARVTPRLDERLESAFTEEDERDDDDDDDATATMTTARERSELANRDAKDASAESFTANDDVSFSFAALKAKYGQSESASEEDDENASDDDDALLASRRASRKETSPPSFPETENAVRAAILSLGGAATPKLTWSAPKDAVWMATGNTTMCRNPGEVLLLLKASDAVAFDLTEAYDCCADVTDEHRARLAKDVRLHLRKWRDLRPALEFRLFVRDGDLVGMCQRDCSNFYPFLTDQKQKDALEETLVLFWQDAVSGVFECADCDSYALDAYVTSANAVKIVDFNHWGGGTLPLMFTWAELEARRRRGGEDPERVASGVEGNESPYQKGFVHDAFEFRVVATQGHIRPGAQLGVPFDMVDGSPGGALAAFAERQREAQEKAFGAFANDEETRNA